MSDTVGLSWIGHRVWWEQRYKSKRPEQFTNKLFEQFLEWLTTEDAMAECKSKGVHQAFLRKIESMTKKPEPVKPF